MSVEINAEGIDRAIAQMTSVLQGLGGKDGAKAIAGALNKALSAGRKTASREARKAYTAPIKKLFDKIKITRARGSNLQGELQISSGKGVSLIHFMAQPNRPGARGAEYKGGVTAQIKRKGLRKERRSDNGGSRAFIRKKKQGGFGVFVRHESFGPDGKKNIKYEMLMGPSPIQHLQRKDAQKAVKEKIEETFFPSLQNEIDRILASGKG